MQLNPHPRFPFMPSQERTLQILFTLFIFVGGFFGFNLMLSILYGSDLYLIAGIFTPAYRTIFLAIGILAILNYIMDPKLKAPAELIFILAIFWGLYGLRIVIDGWILKEILRMPPTEYVMRAFGITAIPMIAFWRPISPQMNRRILVGIFITLWLTTFISIITYKSYFGESYRSLQYKEGIDAATLISPLILSYNGSISISLGVWAFFNYHKQSISKAIFLLSLILIGLITIYIGASRGAFIACGIILLLLLYTQAKTKPIARSFLYVAFLLLISIVAIYILDASGSSISERITGLIEEIKYMERGAGGGRLNLWINALSQFANDPLIGSGLEEEKSLFYPHNHIIEAFMTTGVLGGLCFIALSIWAWRAAIKILMQYPQLGWISVVYINFFIAGLFSSPIIRAELWYSIIAVIAAERSIRQIQPQNKPHYSIKRYQSSHYSKA